MAALVPLPSTAAPPAIPQDPTAPPTAAVRQSTPWSGDGPTLPPPHRIIRGAASTFTLTLFGPFPADAADAVAMGLQVWADVWPSAVPVAVGALWSLPPTGSAAEVDSAVPTDATTNSDVDAALARTAAPVFLRGRAPGLGSGPGTGSGTTGGAGRLDTMYGWAMANAMAGVDLLAESGATAGLTGADRYHLFVRYSGTRQWYTGEDPDGVGRGEWDLATVTVHEVAHGLIFQGQLTAGEPSVAVTPAGTTATAAVTAAATEDSSVEATRPGAGEVRCNDTAAAAAVAGTTAGTVRQFGAAPPPVTRFDSLLAIRRPTGGVGALLPACGASAATLLSALTGGGLAFVAPAVPEGLSLYAPSPLVPGTSVYHLDPSRAAADCAAAGLQPPQTVATTNTTDAGVSACVGAMTPTLGAGVSARWVGTALQVVMAAMMDDAVLPAAEALGGLGCAVDAAPFS